MDEETNKIRQHIDYEREQLGRNLDEIEDRVKNATDFKAHFDKNTGVILGAAVAGGFLLSLAFRKSRAAQDAEGWDSDLRERNTRRSEPKPVSRHIQRVSETIDNIFEGLIAVASDKLHSFVADAVPGFQEQYEAIDRQRGRSSIHQMRPGSGPDIDLSAAK